MGDTSIEWTATILPDGRKLKGYSFNPWIGCTEISPGCAGCYAAKLARRLGVKFGPGEPRRYASESYWDQPIRWNARAAREGIRRRVFCASMADIFDNEVQQVNRDWLWEIIEETPHLDWLVLTKRIGNAKTMLPARWLESPRPNVWLGATVVNQEEASRDVPKLLATPARIRFLSCEPLLGPIDLRGIWQHCPVHDFDNGFCVQDCGNWQRVSWVIVGGESGHHARPMHPAWAYSLRDQCVGAGVPFFFKQWGEWKHMGYSAAEAGPDGDDGVVLEADDPRWRPYMWRRGKKLAGRILNDRTWDEFPREIA